MQVQVVVYGQLCVAVLCIYMYFYFVFLKVVCSGVDPSNPYRLRSLADGCPLSKDLGFEAGSGQKTLATSSLSDICPDEMSHEVPFTIKTTAQIQAFRELGKSACKICETRQQCC